ncbi:MAG: ABC transporter substrate-binding protein, partial [Oscillospiraceae bacterium]
KEESLKLRRNAEYISENFPDTDSVIFTILSKMKMPATKENRFLNGKTSAVATDGSQIKTFPEKSGIIESNQNTVWGILFQLKDGAFSNANLRKSLIIDSDFLMMEEKLPLHFQRMRAIVPQNICIGDKRYRDLAGKDLTLPYQPIEAKELYQKGLAELKMKEVANAVIIVPDGLGHEDYLSYLSQIWQRDLGLYLVVEVLDSESYEARLASGDFDCAIASLSGDYNSPSAILSDFSSGSPKNTIGFSNAEYDRLLIAAPKQVDPQKAAETYLQAEKILMEQGAFLPMYEQSTYFVKDQNAAGIRYNFDNKMVDFRMTSANENQAEKK